MTLDPTRRPDLPEPVRAPLLARRQLLRAATALGALALLPGGAAAAAAPWLQSAQRTRRVVLVVFGGGVRSRELLGSGNTPNLDRIAAAGVTYPRTSVRNLGHYGASAAIFTGASENFGIRENVRPSAPTLFEYLRKGAGLPAGEVWLSTSGSEQESNLSHGLDSRYGRNYGANLIGGEGVFNPTFRRILSGEQGLPPADAGQERLVAKLREALPAVSGGQAADAEAAARIEGYILDELRGGTTAVTGLGAADVKALRVARNLLGIFRPRLLAVTLGAADVAHGSFNDYVQVIRRNDEELGRLHDAIRQDAELAASTALFVLPEFGRDRDLNSRRGLDHGDDSRELHEVTLVTTGPDFRSGRVVNSEVRSTDVCPTVAGLFGTSAVASRGSVLPGLRA